MTQTPSPRTAKVGDALPPFVRETGFLCERLAFKTGTVMRRSITSSFRYTWTTKRAEPQATRPLSAWGISNGHICTICFVTGLPTTAKLSLQFRSANTKGQMLTAGGVVTAVQEEESRRVLELDVWVDNQDGARMAPGTATVVVCR